MEKPETESFFNPPAWQTRAWTFQERAISPRAIVWTGSTVYWACRSTVWYETLGGEPDCCYPTKYPTSLWSGWPTFQLRLSPWPDIEQYFELVNGYNTRNLTFESDALIAFSAITTAMSNSFVGGFLFGIPAFLFDIGLLWSRASPLTRRNGFPSWSWLGWSGRVGLPFGYSFLWEPTLKTSTLHSVEICPLIDWYATHRDGRSDYPIDNSYHRYKSAVHQQGVPLPEGWAEAYDLPNDYIGFSHSSLPECVFKYPFPVSSSIMKFSPAFSPYYLKVRTKLCTLRLGGCYPDEESSSTCLSIYLQDDTGRWAGVVDSLLAVETEYARGCFCEVIAISRGSAQRRMPDKDIYFQAFNEMDKVDEIKFLDSYAFYNVLWIEMIQGVAYRKAVGRVWEDAWEQLATKEVDILLG